MSVRTRPEPVDPTAMHVFATQETPSSCTDAAGGVVASLGAGNVVQLVALHSAAGLAGRVGPGSRPALLPRTRQPSLEVQLDGPQ